jgi:hypothetical protein
MLRYNYKKNTWNISDENHINSNQVHCCIHIEVNNPIDIPNEKKWLIFDQSENEHIEQTLTITVEEKEV